MDATPSISAIAGAVGRTDWGGGVGSIRSVGVLDGAGGAGAGAVAAGAIPSPGGRM